jgi:hypothetical protein
MERAGCKQQLKIFFIFNDNNDIEVFILMIIVIL